MGYVLCRSSLGKPTSVKLFARRKRATSSAGESREVMDHVLLTLWCFPATKETETDDREAGEMVPALGRPNFPVDVK